MYFFPLLPISSSGIVMKIKNMKGKVLHGDSQRTAEDTEEQKVTALAPTKLEVRVKIS